MIFEDKVQREQRISRAAFAMKLRQRAQADRQRRKVGCHKHHRAERAEKNRRVTGRAIGFS